MTDTTIMNTHAASSQGYNYELQAFHASLMPYVIRCADRCSEVVVQKTIPVGYPLRYTQIQEAVNALRQQSQPFNGDRQRTARTVSIMLTGNLYHSPMCQQRLMVDMREDLNDVVYLDADFLHVVALSGHHYQFDIDQVAAWRVDDSWSYIADGAEERTLGHILNDIDMELQMPQGLKDCLSRRTFYMASTEEHGHGGEDCALTDLFDEYRSLLSEETPVGEVNGLRVQVMPASKNVMGWGGPCAFLDPDTALDDSITFEGDYLHITKIDGLPFVVRCDTITGYQVQHVRNVLSDEEERGCGDTEVTVISNTVL